MRIARSNNFVLGIAGAVLLGIALLGPSKAMALTIDPSASLPGIAMAGAPSFNFNDTGTDYSDTIQSWYTNIFYVGYNGAGNGYTMYAYNEGDFTYWEDSTTSYKGVDGVFNLQAEFDDNGVLQSGSVSITGIIDGIGITTDSALMGADLIAYASQANLLGFSIDNISCAAQIINCLSGPESVYFQTATDVPDIASLAGNDYQTTMASKTTVPVPAAVWLMFSGLGLLGAFARRRKCASDQGQ
jgi:hypothetical protein